MNIGKQELGPGGVLPASLHWSLTRCWCPFVKQAARVLMKVIL